MSEQITGLHAKVTADAGPFAATMDKAAREVAKTAKSIKSHLNALEAPARAQKSMDALVSAIEQTGGKAKLSTAQIEILTRKVEGLAKAGAKIPEAFKGLGSTATPGLTSLLSGAGLQDLKAQAGQLAGPLGSVGTVLSSLGPSGLIAAAGIGAAATASSALIRSGREVIEYGGMITDMSARTDVSAEALQKFDYAARQTGTSLPTVITGLTQMSKALVDTPQDFKRLNISVDELRAMRPEDAFLKVGDAIKELPTQAERASAAMAIFGKSGTELLPAFEAGLTSLGDRAERLGFVFSDAAIAGGDAWGDALTDIELAWDRMWQQAAAGLIAEPEFQSMLEGIIQSLGEAVGVAKNLGLAFAEAARIGKELAVVGGIFGGMNKETIAAILKAAGTVTGVTALAESGRLRAQGTTPGQKVGGTYADFLALGSGATKGIVGPNAMESELMRQQEEAQRKADAKNEAEAEKNAAKRQKRFEELRQELAKVADAFADLAAAERKADKAFLESPLSGAPESRGGAQTGLLGAIEKRTNALIDRNISNLNDLGPGFVGAVGGNTGDSTPGKQFAADMATIDKATELTKKNYRMLGATMADALKMAKKDLKEAAKGTMDWAGFLGVCADQAQILGANLASKVAGGVAAMMSQFDKLKDTLGPGSKLGDLFSGKGLKELFSSKNIMGTLAGGVGLIGTGLSLGKSLIQGIFGGGGPSKEEKQAAATEAALPKLEDAFNRLNAAVEKLAQKGLDGLAKQFGYVASKVHASVEAAKKAEDSLKHLGSRSKQTSEQRQKEIDDLAKKEDISTEEAARRYDERAKRNEKARQEEAKKAGASLAESKANLEEAQKSLEQLGIIGAAAMAQMRKDGRSLVDVMEELGPSIDSALAAIKDSESLLGEGKGLSLGGMFGDLADLRDKVNANKELVDAATSFGDVVAGMRASGSLTFESFGSSMSYINGLFDDLISKGFSENEALSMLGPAFLQLKDLAARFGWTLDEDTAKLLGMAESSGALDGLKDPMTEVNESLQMMIMILTELGYAMGMVLPPQIQKYVDAMKAALAVNDQIGKTTPPGGAPTPGPPPPQTGPPPGGGRPYALGGWAGMHGPEQIWVGERGPEFVSAAHALRSFAGGGHVDRDMVARLHKNEWVLPDDLMAKVSAGGPVFNIDAKWSQMRPQEFKQILQKVVVRNWAGAGTTAGNYFATGRR